MQLYLSNFVFFLLDVSFLPGNGIEGPLWEPADDERDLNPDQERNHAPADQYDKELQSKYQYEKLYS